LSKIPGIRTFMVMPPALPGGGQFPVEMVISSTAEPEQILEFARQLQQVAATNGMFAFPPVIDTKIQWGVFVVVFIPIAIGLMIFGYYALRGEYDHLPESSSEL
jgi:hypothetical protein